MGLGGNVPATEETNGDYLNCPNCGGQLDNHLAVNTGELFKPAPGDIGICWYCGSRNMIDGEGRLVELDKETETRLSEHEKNLLQQAWERWNEKQSIRGS